jgi:hypothetical protein
VFNYCIYNDTWDKGKKEKLLNKYLMLFSIPKHFDDVSLIDEEQTSKSFLDPQIFNFFLINEIIEENISVSRPTKNNPEIEIRN